MDLSRNHLNLLKNIATANGFQRYEIEIKSKNPRGQGFSGKITPIVIKDEEKTLNLILKRSLVSEQFKEFIREIYTREIYIYEVVLEAFDKFQNVTVGRKLFDHAIFYGKCDDTGEEAIVLESLAGKGYKLWDKSVPMDGVHIEAVLIEYGRLHAVSFAMKEKNPDIFSELTSKFMDKDGKHAKSFVDSVKNDLANAAKGSKRLEEAYVRLIETGEEFFSKSLAEEKDKMVIRHGDCWCNNVLFKYKENRNETNPSSVRLIDWQLSRVGNPILDLSYFFYVSSPKEVLNEHRKYLKIYHDSLSRTLKDLSCDPDKLYPFLTFERHWKKYSKYGIYVAPMIFKILHTNDEEKVPELQDFKTGKEFYEQMEKAGNRELTKRKLRDLLKFMVDNELV